MSLNDVSVVLVHGAWADGSSWSKVIGPLRAEGARVVAAPLPLTSLTDDAAALDRTLERIEGPVVLVGHAYAGAVIAATRDEKVRSLVYIAALAPDEGETVADVFYRAEPHPRAPKLAPTNMARSGFPTTPLPRLSLNMLPPRSRRCWLPFSGRSPFPASASSWAGRSGRVLRAGSSSPSRTA
jgi:pimeloyl-ACP methyl ester carboxylesterase